MEEGDTLSLLKTIPRDWMEDGKEIVIEDVQSYFGPLYVQTYSHVDDGIIGATIKCNTSRKLKEVVIRLPHPEEKIPKRVFGGAYDTKTGSITISNFTGHAEVRLEFQWSRRVPCCNNFYYRQIRLFVSLPPTPSC